MRLDTICFTLGFATTIADARQLVNHGHITVNDKVVRYSKFSMSINDVIGVKPKTTSKNLIERNLKTRNYMIS